MGNDKPPAEGTPPTPPASGAPADGGGAVDMAALEALVRKVFDEKAAALKPPAGDPPPPATPPAGGGGGALDGAPKDLAAMVEQAVSSALERRDSQDALAVLADEVDALKRAVTSQPARRKGWGAYLLGPGFSR